MTKLDLTLNHIPLSALASSLSSLASLTFLHQLYLTGNPCTQWPHYRAYTLHTLPSLTSLDGKDVTRTERIEASTLSPSFPSLLSQAIAALPTEGEKSSTAFTPELRMKMYQESLPASTPTVPSTPPDLYHDAHVKLSQWVEGSEYEEGRLPSQRNTGRYGFTLKEEGACWVLTVATPRHMDTSLMKVDVHPLWLQVAVKDKLLVLHLEEEVEVGTAVVQRVIGDGEFEGKDDEITWGEEEGRRMRGV